MERENEKQGEENEGESNWREEQKVYERKFVTFHSHRPVLSWFFIRVCSHFLPSLLLFLLGHKDVVVQWSDVLASDLTSTPHTPLLKYSDLTYDWQARKRCLSSSPLFSNFFFDGYQNQRSQRKKKYKKEERKKRGKLCQEEFLKCLFHCSNFLINTQQAMEPVLRHDLLLFSLLFREKRKWRSSLQDVSVGS